MIAISGVVKPPLNIVRMFGRPFVATAVMAAAAWASNGLLCRVMSPRIAVLGAIVIACGVYFVLALLLKVINREDLVMLPKGEKLADLLRLPR